MNYTLGSFGAVAIVVVVSTWGVLHFTDISVQPEPVRPPDPMPSSHRLLLRQIDLLANRVTQLEDRLEWMVEADNSVRMMQIGMPLWEQDMQEFLQQQGTALTRVDEELRRENEVLREDILQLHILLGAKIR